jgi:hypothetical protein
MYSVIDIVYVVVIQACSWLSAVSNATLAFIFCSPQFKDIIYKYLTLNSAVDCVIVIILTPLPFYNSSLVPTWKTSYAMQLYTFVVTFYLGRVLGLVSSLINLKIASDRFVIVRKKFVRNHMEEKKSYKLSLLVIFVFSFVVFSPKLLTTSIVRINANTTQSNFSGYEIIEKEPMLNMISNIVIIPIFAGLVVVNIALTLMINRKNNDRAELPAKNRSQFWKIVVYRQNTRRTRRSTMTMVLWITTISALSLLIKISVTILFLQSNTASVLNQRGMSFLLHFFVVFCNGVNIFIYYTYNQRFATSLKMLISNFICFKHQKERASL